MQIIIKYRQNNFSIHFRFKCDSNFSQLSHSNYEKSASFIYDIRKKCTLFVTSFIAIQIRAHFSQTMWQLNFFFHGTIFMQNIIQLSLISYIRFCRYDKTNFNCFSKLHVAFKVYILFFQNQQNKTKIQLLEILPMAKIRKY